MLYCAVSNNLGPVGDTEDGIVIAFFLTIFSCCVACVVCEAPVLPCSSRPTTGQESDSVSLCPYFSLYSRHISAGPQPAPPKADKGRKVSRLTFEK